MAYHGPSYGLSRECQMKSQAKFDPGRAGRVLEWVEAVTGAELELPASAEGVREQGDFGAGLRDGAALCQLLNCLKPGSVKKINTMKAPFKQRENIELFLKGCEAYGLKSQDLFQVNDLYESKNLYMVVDCLYALGGIAQKNGYEGPVIGVKVAKENRRTFSEEVLKASDTFVPLQSGSNKGASQAGMVAYGTGRQIIPSDSQKTPCEEGQRVLGLQCGSNKGASQAGMTPYGATRQIMPEEVRTPPEH